MKRNKQQGVIVNCNIMLNVEIYWLGPFLLLHSDRIKNTILMRGEEARLCFAEEAKFTASMTTEH